MSEKKASSAPSSVKPRPRPWIDGLEVYVGGKSKAKGNVKPVKLSSNESALGASPMAVEAYDAARETLHRYPDGSYQLLRNAISEKYGIKGTQIICGVGSDEILKLACRAYLSPGDEAIFSRHSFMMYPIAATSVGGVPVEVDDTDYTTRVDNIIAATTDKTRIIFIANPNNPTGTYISGDEVERLWQATPKDVLIVLDGAYAEFVDKSDFDSGIDMATKMTNVIITRTFSKLYGLAAIRLGWGYACQDIIDALDKIRDPFNVPTSAQMAGTAALKDVEFEKRAFDHNLKWLSWLTDEISKLGLYVVPSVANFILIRFKDGDKSAEKANDFLLERGYILRWLPNQGLGDCLRLTVGTEDENKQVVKLLTEFLK